MAVSVLINGYDLRHAFGVYLEDGGLQVFEIPATPKEPFYNEWSDQNGRDYDTDSPVVYQAQTFEVPFLMSGSSIVDYRKKKKDFMSLIDFNGEFDLQIIDWGEAFRLRYKGVVSWSFINLDLGSSTSARFVLRLECNHNKGYVFRYLTDNIGRYIVINDNQKILVKTTY